MIVTVAELKEALGLTADLGASDDALLGRTIAAAQGLIERQLGFAIETTYAVEVPAPLQQAVSLLACHWYENREATLVGVTAQEIPFGVQSIVNEYRDYSFDG
jgi:hypothetical protein